MKKINTYNESPLHRTLKKIYALENDGKCEVQIEGTNWICDIVCDDARVIEIQTANISALAEKTEFLLGQGRSVMIVCPVIFQNTIIMLNENGEKESKRKSPKKSTIYSFLRGIGGIIPLLKNQRLTVEFLYVSVTELRRKTGEKTQLANKSRRYLKQWVPEGKSLDKILKIQRFTGLDSWKTLFPKSLPPEFTKTELYDAIFSSDFLIPDLIGEKFTDTNRRASAIWYDTLLWFGKKCNIIEECGKRGRKILYRRTRMSR